MIIISFRSLKALDNKYKSLEEKMKESQRQYRYVTQAIEIQSVYLEKASDEDEYSKVSKYLDSLKRQAAELKMEIEQMKSKFTSSDQIEEDKSKFGFSMSAHAQDRYNQRFTPYLNRAQLFGALQKLGLGQKIKNDNSQGIKLLPNFIVVVANHEVVTFLYDEQNRDQKTKHDLGKIW